jgi:hypothetical protein
MISVFSTIQLVRLPSPPRASPYDAGFFVVLDRMVTSVTRKRMEVTFDVAVLLIRIRTSDEKEQFWMNKHIGYPTNREHPALGSRPEVKVRTIVNAQELIMIH